MRQGFERATGASIDYQQRTDDEASITEEGIAQARLKPERKRSVIWWNCWWRSWPSSCNLCDRCGPQDGAYCCPGPQQCHRYLWTRSLSTRRSSAGSVREAFDTLEPRGSVQTSRSAIIDAAQTPSSFLNLERPRNRGARFITVSNAH